MEFENYNQSKDYISVKYFYSACILTSTPDISILHDPWFTDGIYDGSWFQYPVIESPVEKIGDVDYLFVSHVHPDHYDPVFIKKYFSKHGEKPILIAPHSPNYLAKKIKSDGLRATIVTEPIVIGGTEIQIVPHKTGSVSDIDSAIVIKHLSKTGRNHCVVNANDINFDKAMVTDLAKIAGEVDILLCGHSGAGPYPQTYFDLDDPMLKIEANRKKCDFQERYLNLTNQINAKINVPFAGKYLLGGRFSNLNEYRGVSDPIEIQAIDDHAIILDDGGGEIDTLSLTPNRCRSQKYSDADIIRRIEEIRVAKMNYENFVNPDKVKLLPFEKLIHLSAQSAIKKSECIDDYFFCIGLPNRKVAIINANRTSPDNVQIIDENLNLPSPRSEISIDPCYLFGLLTNVFHWNNAAIGSHYSVRRFPNTFNRSAQAFLHFLAI